MFAKGPILAFFFYPNHFICRTVAKASESHCWPALVCISIAFWYRKVSGCKINALFHYFAEYATLPLNLLPGGKSRFLINETMRAMKLSFRRRLSTLFLSSPTRSWPDRVHRPEHIRRHLLHSLLPIHASFTKRPLLWNRGTMVDIRAQILGISEYTSRSAPNRRNIAVVVSVGYGYYFLRLHFLVCGCFPTARSANE